MTVALRFGRRSAGTRGRQHQDPRGTFVGSPDPCSEQVLLLQNAEVVRAEARTPRSEDAQFLWDSACKGHTEGVSARPVHVGKMDQTYGAGKWSGLHCFCVAQASGKSRRIDNGERSRTNKATSYSESSR